MLILLEGLVMCFILLLICVIGIADSPVGLVTFYEPEVQERVVELGLTTKERIRRNTTISTIALFAPILFLVPAMVFCINGTRGFWEVFWEILAVLMIMGVFDRIFIDWYWVGRTKTWLIPGTEDLMPYIPKEIVIGKWLGTLVGYPIIAAIESGILLLF